MVKELDTFFKELTGKNEVTDDQELESAMGAIWEIGKALQLDPYSTHFEVIPPKKMYEIGSYALPERFSHWTHGRIYRQQKTMYDYGLAKIYELVINSNPAQAFLLENNEPIHNKFVVAHVMGHSDFFKNNHTFQATQKDMPESASLHAERIREFEEREGRLKVEQFLDAVLAIDEHIDPYSPHRLSRDEELAKWREESQQQDTTPVMGEYDDLWELGQGQLHTVKPPRTKLPPRPDKDILGFIRNYAPYLEDWERDVIDIVRTEAHYFHPQMRTKIMNEGWASFWHKRILREMADQEFITPEENEEWWKLHSGVLHQNPKGPLNPYYFGMKMYEYIEDVHNGHLTYEESKWREKQGLAIYPKFEGELQESPALQVLREIMEANDDQSFIRNYFDKNIAERLGMYIYQKEEAGDGTIYYVVKDKGWQEIRDRLVASMVNCGNPYLTVEDGDYEHRRELYLKHQFDGQELDPEYVKKTLPYIHYAWRRPVHLETFTEGIHAVYSYDGKKFEAKGK